MLNFLKIWMGILLTFQRVFLLLINNKKSLKLITNFIIIRLVQVEWAEVIGNNMKKRKQNCIRKFFF